MLFRSDIDKIENFKRITAMILCILTVSVILYLTVFDAASIRHKCSGADCPVCNEMHIANTLTKQLLTSVVPAAVRFLLVMYAILVFITRSNAVIMRNLIIDKVRLDH